ncbi:SusC/RagA family TonB-linked outer membrane protein [Euzebyella saccharophila]|uniref:SusC/RagA family TonB-linked outer membrane protein n=1 Tax=Euzebyella saccharophila TaxID=679664 RepID=A0ABV8JJP7_9FLAO|nr:SusC/RagA family TonB-linked outer membrane protein [Euzebyella saccharophila]
MRAKHRGLLTLFLALFVQITFAQDKTITGTVADADGLPLPGVNIVVQGTTVGTQTDFDGNYAINASQGQTLSFSYLGYKTETRAVGASNTINLQMTEDAESLEEVVVTAMGITKAEKAIGYAVQEVSGESIEETKEVNIVNSLQGKVSGVQIQGSSSALGGSSRITIRGSNSFLGNNQPLFVVDGVPISNQSFSSQDQERGFGDNAYDYGNTASDLDPSSIETMSVLKGAAATAIYGSRGANGVILITTKNGSSNKGLGVSFESSVTMDEVRNLIPHQQTYGGGSIYDTASGFNEFTQDGVSYLAPNYGKDGSWGPKYNSNVLVRHWDSWDPGASNYKETRPWVAPPNSYESFFNTGLTMMNSIALSGSDDKGSFRLSYTNLDQTGTTPGGSLQRNTVSLNSTYNLTEKLTAGVSMSYIRTDAQNRNITGYNNGNPLQGFYQWWQTQLDVDRLKSQQNTTLGEQYTWNATGIIEDDNGNLLEFDSFPNYFDNPYWVRNNFLQEDWRNRVFGNANFSYEITKGLSLSSQFGTDITQFSLREGIPQRGIDQSKYVETERKFQENNFEVRLNYQTDFSEDFSFTGLLGANRMRQYTKRHTVSTSGGLVVDKFFNVSNSSAAVNAETYQADKGINSIFGSTSFGFKDMLYLDLSARNDWSSTLPADNNSYFYPAASMSFVLTELDFLRNNDIVNFVKLRASIAQAGNDADPYRLTDVYNPLTPNFGSLPMYTVPNSQQNPDLVNELTTETEFGISVRLFQSRLTLDASYYDRLTEDQIFNVPTSSTTGYSSKLLNAGSMKNKGIELQLNVTPIRTEDFTWDIGFNVTKQENEVVELLKDENGESIVESINVTATWGADLRIQEGKPYMAVFGQDFIRDENGNKVVGDDGAYLYTDDRVYLGSAIADYVGGINTSFRYKNFTLSGLVDFQEGGIIHSASLMWAKYSGMLPETVSFNGESDIRANGLLLPGVTESGAPNTTRIDAQGYHTDNYQRAASHVYDASFVKLRDVRLSYSFPAKFIKGTPIKDLNLSVFGRNLAILSADVPYIDPQIIAGAGNAQGLENSQVPATRSFGVNLSAKF